MTKNKTQDETQEKPGADLMTDGFHDPNSSDPLAEQMLKLKIALDKQEEARQDSRKSSLGARTPRSTREMETREEADYAEETWQPAAVLPDPPQRDGWVHHWVRGSSRGETDKMNMARAIREGWVPCQASEYPEVIEAMIGEDRGRNLIEFGGLILCRLSTAKKAARDKYFKNLSLRQIDSVNQKLRDYEHSEGGALKVLNSSSSNVKGLIRRG